MRPERTPISDAEAGAVRVINPAQRLPKAACREGFLPAIESNLSLRLPTHSRARAASAQPHGGEDE